MATQTEAIAAVAKTVGGPFFATQPTKGISSAYAEFVPDYSPLIASHEPLAIVAAYIDDLSEPQVVSVAIDDKSLFSNLPFLSLYAFQKNPVVLHVEIGSLDYSIVTALMDSSYTVLISQTPTDALAHARAAYALAKVQNAAVFHFYAPSLLASAASLKSTSVPEAESVPEALQKADVEPFTTLNKVSTPQDAVLFLGQLSRALADAFTANNALLYSINVLKPLDLGTFLSLLPSSVNRLTLVEQSAQASSFSPLLLEFFKHYPENQGSTVLSQIVGAKWGFVSDEEAKDVAAKLLANTRSQTPAQNTTFGNLKQSKPLNGSLSTKSSAEDKVFALEQAYFKVLKQVNEQSRILNEYSAKNVGVKTQPEFGFGSFLQFKTQQGELVAKVASAIQNDAFSSLDNEKLIKQFSEWLVSVKEGKQAFNVDEILNLLSSDSSDAAQEILKLKEFLDVTPQWLVGSDAWSYDLGSSGVHNVIASGENINMLIIDSEPYLSKKQQLFRKKDVGLYAMNYGNCYVASIAIYSSYTQVLQAFIEAEKFNGPSVILAYLPYHTEDSDVLSILKETKSAVDSGYWPLYRYDPSIDDETLRFKLDSSSLRNQLKEFLDRENKLTLLARKNPVLSRNLTATANSQIKKHQVAIEDESYRQLLQGLSGPPLTICFASDGGSAEAVARKINRQALGRGLKSVVLAMDEIAVEDLPLETNIVFVSSTAGQGEIPNNGKAFWDGLKQAQDLDLSAVKFSVFGLGDSKYWPRKEDKHYYNKPGKDLFAKMKLYGAVELTDIGLGDDQDPDGYNTGYEAWLPGLWTALGVDNVEGVEDVKPLTNEDMKIQSDYLRGTIAEGLRDESTGAICAVDQQLTKFHGIYMQDDRDIREERKLNGLEPAYSFMVRLRLPGGFATPRQYLKLDELADVRGNGTLKITTRATFQLHGIIKHNMKPAIRGMNSVLLDTLAACGDVNRNVMVSALPENAKVHLQIAETGTLISEYLLPQTTAYHEIWLEGADESDKPGDREVWENRKDGPKKKKTMVAGNALVDHEPQYGPTYLPRKFKVVITVPPYNDVDVYAHDIGLIAIVEDNNVIGYNLVAGGGMGSTHNNVKTYPRTGSMMGYVAKEKVHIACENIMLVQRDNGDRTNRKHARLKYTIDDMGVDVFKRTVEEYWGEKFKEPKPFVIKSNIDYFGWVKDELGLNHFTAFIENGRIEDTPELPQKTGLKEISKFLIKNDLSGEFRLTGNQHLLVSNIEDKDLEDIKGLLAKYKLDNTNFSALRLLSSSCVALPTCGLAMAESERYLPELISKLEEALEEYGLRHDSVVMRMTGCPNGCARPWVAEVAMVGKAMGAYNLMLGGGHHGQRLNKIYRYSIKESEILAILKPLFKRWSLERQEGEPFGDFCIRIGVIKETTEGKFFHEDIPEEA